MKLNFKKVFLSSTSLDVIIFALITGFCFLAFQHPDMRHTAGSALAYVAGHFKDFYEFNKPILKENNYLPSTYILFAVWAIPVKLLGLVKEPGWMTGNVILWFKLLTTVFYFASGYVIFKIGQLLSFDKYQARLLSFVWLTSPLAVFSQFVFGQYDIFTVFFMMAGLYFFIRKKLPLFVLLFSVAITFKYFPIFIFFPLLLLAEKRISRIFLYSCAVFVPLLFEVLIYLNSPAFITGVFGFQANQRVLWAGIQISPGLTSSFFVMGWICICAFAYLKEISSRDDFRQWSTYLPMLVLNFLFSLLLWHPQWLIILTPFMVLTTFQNKQAKFYLILDILLMYFFVAYTVNMWAPGVDQSLWNGGMFAKFNIWLSDNQINLFMRNIFKPNDIGFYYSLIAGILWVHMLFKWPRKDNITDNFVINKYWNIARIRFILGMFIFILPATVCLFYPSFKGVPLLEVKGVEGKIVPAGEINKGVEIGQVFQDNYEDIKKIAVMTATYARNLNSHLIFQIHEFGHEEPLFKTIIEPQDIKNNDYFSADVDRVNFEKGKSYTFYFSSDDAVTGDSATIWRRTDKILDKNSYAIINGQAQNYDLLYSVYGTP